MKKFILSLILILLPLITYSLDDCVSSGLRTTSSIIRSYAGSVCDIVITTDATTTCSLLCYDNATGATGVAISPSLSCTNNSGSINTCIWSNINRKLYNGLYCTMTTLGTCSYTVGTR